MPDLTIRVDLTLTQLEYLNVVIARDINARNDKLKYATPDKKPELLDKQIAAYSVLEEIQGAIGCIKVEGEPSIFNLKTGHKVEITNYGLEEILLRFVRNNGFGPTQSFPRHEVEALLATGETLPGKETKHGTS